MQIHEYVYDNVRQPVGVFAATASASNPNRVVIGWSRCNRAAGDRFDKKRGLEIAWQRSYTSSQASIPDSMSDQYVKFLSRAQRYFKNKVVQY